MPSPESDSFLSHVEKVKRQVQVELNKQVTSGKQRYITCRVLKVYVKNLLSPSFLFRWMLLDGVEQKTMYDLTYFRKDNSATLLRKKVAKSQR